MDLVGIIYLALSLSACLIVLYKSKNIKYGIFVKKGLFIGLVIGILLFIHTVTIALVCFDSCPNLYNYLLYLSPVYYLFKLTDNSLIIALSGPFICALVGALIGYIIGKVKSRKQKVKKK